MKIVDSSNTRAVNALIDRRPGRDAGVYRRVARIVERVRRDGDRALVEYAKRFDGRVPPLELPRQEIEARARAVTSEVPDGAADGGQEHPAGGTATGAA